MNTNENEFPTPAMRMFQVREDDLQFLEETLPRLMDHGCFQGGDVPRDVQELWDMTRSIVSKVRWNYGPPSTVEIIKPDDLIP